MPMRPPPSVRARTVELLATSTRLVAASFLIREEIRAERLQRWTDKAYILSRTAISGGMEQSSEESIRDLIRKRLASGQLRSTDGMIVNARIDNGACSACELEIEHGESATLGYLYRDSMYHGFHARCVVLWEEERRPGSSCHADHANQ